MRAGALFVILLAACGSKYPDETEVYEAVREGGTRCFARVNQAVNKSAAGWVYDFVESLEPELEAQAAAMATEETYIEFVVKKPNGDALYFDWDDWTSEFSFRAQSGGHTFRIARSVRGEYGETDYAAEVDDYAVSTFHTTVTRNIDREGSIEGNVSCAAGDLTYTRRLGYGYEVPDDDTVIFTDGPERWAIFGTVVKRREGYDPARFEGYTGEACHNEYCTGVAELSISSAVAPVGVSTPIPQLLRDLTNEIQRAWYEQ